MLFLLLLPLVIILVREFAALAVLLRPDRLADFAPIFRLTCGTDGEQTREAELPLGSTIA